ncbi:MAG: BTAD domain-containing putative transcriptional regulator [Gemmatimonadales bacterium]
MLSLKVLGDPVLLGPDGPITGRAAYKRRIALLSILSVARGRPVGRERLIALLWPEHASDAARHTLSESLYVLRRELGDGVFLSVGDEIALSPDVVQSDVGAFEEALEEGRLEDAAAEYRGPLLDGFYVSDAPEFERWVEEQRGRLARRAGEAMIAAARGAEATGDPTGAAEWWRRAAATDPYDARVALGLVQALARAGDRPGALREAGRYESWLRQELSVAPDPAFQQAVAAIRREVTPS